MDSTPVVMARSPRCVAFHRDLLGERRRGRGRWQLTRDSDSPGPRSRPGATRWSRASSGATRPRTISVEAEFARSLGVGSKTPCLRRPGRDHGVPRDEPARGGLGQLPDQLLPARGAGRHGGRLAGASPPRASCREERGLQARVVEAFLNVGVLRVRPLLERVASMLGRIALAVRLLGGFTILTGIAILAGAVAASSMRRGGGRAARRWPTAAASRCCSRWSSAWWGWWRGSSAGSARCCSPGSSSPSASTWRACPAGGGPGCGPRHGGSRGPRRPRGQRAGPGFVTDGRAAALTHDPAGPAGRGCGRRR